ncbi:MAG TPA: DPP IV N-terminal domain-containing protein [Blastocatellia bacterium]|nr:DPP IV N-terminal domain-containing protein [Blastocatellia bacterium]
MTRIAKLPILPLLFTLLLIFRYDGSVQSVQSSQTNALPYFTEPSVSPGGSEIAFVSGGDIWTAPVNGGEARLLVSHPANESRPLYSPDGKRLAFVSTRTGNGDIYALTFETGELKRLTFDDASEQLDAWSRDGRFIYFSSTSRDISGMNDLFRVKADGGTPMLLSADRYANEYWAAPAPDGNSVAFTARGVTSSQWWRNGRSHLDECEIWLLRDSGYERFTDGGVKEMWPMWGADGKHIYFVSDRGGAQNIWVKPIGGAAKQITKFKDGRVLWPNISYDGKLIVFERNFKIWKLDTGGGNASEVPITRRGAPAGPAVERVNVSSQLSELALSPDGKKVAFIAHGEVFAASAKDGGDAARVTRTHAAESQVVWAPDSKRIAYVSDREGAFNIYSYDFATSAEAPLTRGVGNNYTPSFSPDGKTLAFIRDGRELRAVDLETKQERLLATAYLERRPFASNRSFTWSPDGKWIAYLAVGERAFTNVSVVSAAGGESRQASFLANAFSGSVSWSPDGKYVLFNTNQRTEDGRLARVDLIPRTPKFREDQFRDLFKDQTPPSQRQEPRPGTPEPQREGPHPAPDKAKDDVAKDEKKLVEIVFENIRQRLSFLPVGVDAGSQVISPDGKWVLMTASAEGQQNLYIYSLDELSREPAVARQLTSTPGFKAAAQFTPDNKEVFYLEQGRINIVNLDTRQTRPLGVTAEMDVDFAKEKMEVFYQAWSYLRDHFYDSNFHGVNWDSVRAVYEPQVAGARTPDEMRRLINLMVGELNASHLGISAPFAPTTASPVQPVGRLGLRFDRVEYETKGHLRVSEVIALSPAAISGQIKTGDYLIAVDDERLGLNTNLDELLANKVGRRVALKIASSGAGTGGDGANAREVIIQPVSQGTEKGLLYRQWVNERRAYVEKISKGRLGYAHMPDMSSNSLTQLYVDLDADNQSREGVVVDIRNNNGGFVNAYAIDVFARRGYMTMTVRGYPPAPARTMLGQRALERPTILVTNQHSLSDAEDFTEGYRALRLGKVVGEPTAGWIIYTWGTTLIDGSNFSLPRQKIQDSAGMVMELNPRRVDIPVSRPIGESRTGKDSQLDAAVSELLKQIDAGRQSNSAAKTQN